MEQLRVLGEPAQLAAPLAHVEAGQFLAVDLELAAIGGKAEQGVDQRTLAGAADADEGGTRAGCQGEVDGTDQHLALGAQYFKAFGFYLDGGVGMERRIA